MNNVQDDRYKRSQAAQASGGPCPICDWRDGDGTRSCFYSAPYGTVRHQNSEAAVVASMSPQQRSLYLLRSELLHIDAERRERDIARVFRKRDEDMLSGRLTRSAEDELAWREQYRADLMAKPLATDPPYREWVKKPWWVPIEQAPADLVGILDTGGDWIPGGEYTAYMVHCYEPHPDCGGRRERVGPYHDRCSVCDTEIKLWEHGVDYDMG